MRIVVHFVFAQSLLLSFSPSSLLFLAQAFGILTTTTERFRATCPADPSSIRQLEPTLIDDDTNNDDGGNDGNEKGLWVAVYRSNQNKPSVINNRDDFLTAMKIATTPIDDDETTSTGGDNNNDNNNNDLEQTTAETSWSNLLETPMAMEKPVAVAQLRPSTDYDNKYVLDSLRCGLKKEEQDETCDGGSEYLEALSVAVDTLLVQYLQDNNNNNNNDDDDDKSATDSVAIFEGTIRTKGTLFSQKVLETRGFAPVEELSKDMATHVSQYETCYECYTDRANNEDLSPGARNRALQIVSLLGRLDKEQELEASSSSSQGGNDDEDSTYDPWAGIGNLRR